jgi:hypothetical protein
MTAVTATSGSSVLHAKPARKSPAWSELRFYPWGNNLKSGNISGTSPYAEIQGLLPEAV